MLKEGIIRFAVPETISKEKTTLLPKELHWIKASVPEKSNSVSQLIGIKAQAVAATFQNNSNDLSHLEKGLPSEKINTLETLSAGIQQITQPYPSFDGQPPESDPMFYQRVSERLRHKNRAVSLFDYERLVLEKFPQVYKVKCISHTEQEKGVENAPGHVSIIVMPDPRKQDPGEKLTLQPLLPASTLEDIKKYLHAHASDFAKITVNNPVYETVKVRCTVAFPQGKDFGFYRDKLKGDITRFLSPWFYDDAQGRSPDGCIHRAWIQRQITALDYVDRISDFIIYHDYTAEKENQAVEKACGTTSASVLVSYHEHYITKEEKNPCDSKAPEEAR